jgi:hypothetical protein
MGTSGSFAGSGGKDASDLRDNIAEWLDTTNDSEEQQDSESSDDNLGNGDLDRPRELPEIDLTPLLRLLYRAPGRAGSSDGPGGGGGGMSSSSGRSSGGVTRSLGRISNAAGRAGRLARAYSTGNREVLAEAGLSYDELRTLGDPVSIGFKIVEATFDSQNDSTIAANEERAIISAVVEWILQSPDNNVPTPEDIVRKTIETTIAETALTEVASTAHIKEADPRKRNSLERQVRIAAAAYAETASLTSSGATEQEISRAIENGFRDIAEIFGVIP